MGDKLRETAIDIINDVPWGIHFCQFYQTKEDLIDLSLPYFKAGLENNKFSIHATSKVLNPNEAKEPLEGKVRDPDDNIAKCRMKIN